MDIAHDVGSKLGSMTERLRERRIESRLEDLDRENIRLRTEVKSLRSDLEWERQEREELLQPLRDRKRSKLVVKPRRRMGVLRMAALGGTAYVLGTKAGRERYEEMKNRVTRAMDKVGSFGRTDRSGDEERSPLSVSGGGPHGGSAANSDVSPPAITSPSATASRRTQTGR